MGPPRKEDDNGPILLEVTVAQTSSAPPGGRPPGKPSPMSYYTSTITLTPTPTDDFWPPDRTDHPKGYPPPWVSNAIEFPPGPWVSSKSTWTALSKESPLSELPVTTSDTTSSDVPGSSPTSAGYGNEGPDWHRKAGMHSGGIYAAVAITPVVVLAIVGAIVFVCIRKRKRQRAGSPVGQTKDEEMKMDARSKPVSQAYMASASNASPQYTIADNHHPLPPDPALLHPIILGPISSGTNGAYFTGIDTSDVVSMTSSNNIRPGPPNPFSDNDSLTEPPPPYRPRSAAPPSLTNSSRQSSFRASMALPATSRTHLIERSPFEDPSDDDDDDVSGLSGPTAGQRDDTMSAVSDLSYQHDPVVNRSSL